MAEKLLLKSKMEERCCKICSIQQYIIVCDNCRANMCTLDCITAVFKIHGLFENLCFACVRPMIDNITKVWIVDFKWIQRYQKYFEVTYHEKANMFLQTLWRVNN